MEFLRKNRSEVKMVSILEYDKEGKKRSSERQSMKLAEAKALKLAKVKVLKSVKLKALRLAKAKALKSAEIKPWQNLYAI